MKPICPHHKMQKYNGILDALAKREYKYESGCEQRQCPACQRWYFHGEFGKGWKAAIKHDEHGKAQTQ